MMKKNVPCGPNNPSVTHICPAAGKSQSFRDMRDTFFITLHYFNNQKMFLLQYWPKQIETVSWNLGGQLYLHTAVSFRGLRKDVFTKGKRSVNKEIDAFLILSARGEKWLD